MPSLSMCTVSIYAEGARRRGRSRGCACQTGAGAGLDKQSDRRLSQRAPDNVISCETMDQAYCCGILGMLMRAGRPMGTMSAYGRRFRSHCVVSATPAGRCYLAVKPQTIISCTPHLGYAAENTSKSNPTAGLKPRNAR